MHNRPLADQRQINEYAALFGVTAEQLTPALLVYGVFIVQRRLAVSSEAALTWLRRAVGTQELTLVDFDMFVQNGSTNIPLLGAFLQFAIDNNLRLKNLDPKSMKLLGDVDGLPRHPVNALRRKGVMWLDVLVRLQQADVQDLINRPNTAELITALSAQGLSLR